MRFELTEASGEQLLLLLQSLYFQTAGPCPSIVPLPVTIKPTMDSNKIHAEEEKSLGSVEASSVPMI